MTVRPILLALRQLGEAATLRLMLRVMLLTLAVFVALGVGLWWVLDRWLLPRFAGTDDGGIAAGLAATVVLLAGWFLFRAVAMLVVGMFTDGVVDSVERAHYPDSAARARPVSFVSGLRLGSRSALRTIGWNLAAAPGYVLLLATGVGTLVLALLVNAILLGRDFEAMVAARHPSGGAHPLSSAQRWTLGLASAGLFLVPFANLAAPVFGAALAVHLLNARKPDA